MYRTFWIAGFALAAATPISACHASPPVEHADIHDQSATRTTGAIVTDAQLPINQRFGSLDEYLAYLERMNAPIDKPWYRQVRPGVYELQTGNYRPLGGDDQKRTFSREELKQKFGFSK